MTFKLYQGDPETIRRASRGGRVYSRLHHGHVVSNELVTTTDVAKRLGLSNWQARERLRKAKHPITWEALQP